MTKYIIILIVLGLIIFYSQRKETYDSIIVTRPLLEKLNTDIGVKNIRLEACTDQCILIPPQKSIYDCQLYEFDEWSICDPNTGTQTRVRNVLFDFGLNCPPPSDVSRLQNQTCAVDCVVSDWSNWNTCTAECGSTGVRSRTRSITTPPLNGGLACPATTEVQACNRVPCPVDCVVGDWSNWNTCTAECGSTGVRSRTRSITTPPLNGGLACPATTEVQACNRVPCPVDCVVGVWNDWSPCSKICDDGSGPGSKIRTRNIITYPQYGGQVCPPIKETIACNRSPCSFNITASKPITLSYELIDSTMGTVKLATITNLGSYRRGRLTATTKQNSIGGFVNLRTQSRIYGNQAILYYKIDKINLSFEMTRAYGTFWFSPGDTITLSVFGSSGTLIQLTNIAIRIESY